MSPPNIAAVGFPYYTPAQKPAAGTAINPQPKGNSIPLLFQPLKIRGVEFHNRIFVSSFPMFATLTVKHVGPLAFPAVPIFSRQWTRDAMASSTS